MILTILGITYNTKESFSKWVKYSLDRPFNDRRYAVDSSKLKKLGWEQKTSIEDGLKWTIDWYKHFGEAWWGDISHVLTPFPMISEGEVVPDLERLLWSQPPTPSPSQEYQSNGRNGIEEGMVPSR